MRQRWGRGRLRGAVKTPSKFLRAWRGRAITIDGTSADTKQLLVARRVAEELSVPDSAAVDTVRDITLNLSYDFLVDTFRPQFFFFEACDMLRKLCLIGLLALMGSGSVAQLYFAAILCVAFICAQTTLVRSLNPRQRAHNASESCCSWWACGLHSYFVVDHCIPHDCFEQRIVQQR